MVRRTISALSKVALGYCLLGFVILPAFLHLAIQLTAPRFLQEPLRIGGILFNPVTLKLDIQTLSLGARKGHPLFGFSNLTVDLSWQSLREGKVILDFVDIDSPQVDIELLDDGSLNITKILKPVNKSVDQSDEASAESSSSDNPLGILIHTVSLDSGAINFTDYANAGDEAVSFKLSSFSIKGDQLSWPKGQGTVELDTRINDESHLSVKADLESQNSVSASVSLDRFSLTNIQPYLTPYLYTSFDGGEFSSDVDLIWDREQGLTAKGSTTLSKLDVSDSRTEDRVAGWQELAIEGFDFSQQQSSLAIKQITLLQLFTKIELGEQLSLNLAELVKPSESPSEAKTKESSAPAFTVNIDSFKLKDGTLDFADRSFKPGFAAPVTGLSGEVRNFDSSSPKSMSIALNGRIHKYSPVNITAELVPLTPLAETQIQLSFKDVELPNLTPYSGRFAGYTIEKGRMDLDLDYEINNKQLNASNRILLKELVLGDKVSGENTTSLPLKLAIALLKDSEGRISVDLPVSGDLDNPQFALGPVIRTAITNFLINIVSAPFNLLASLVSGDADEMSSIQFVPGSSAPNKDQEATLASLATALSERPQLELEVQGAALRSIDAPVIAKQQLLEELSLRYRKQAGLADVAGKPEKVLIPDEEAVSLLMAMVQERSLKAGAQTKAALTDTLIENWQVEDAALRSLAVERARTLKDKLVEKGLKAPRIYILASDLSPKVEDGEVVTSLTLSAD
ncbi:hypothetical protein EOPP23_20590 [Endozoicomonas sp. OPT23]|uniref:DUF748 domain-containing protein n=1 Tax=Endozoicomonas sp. OPT23 TaxID=2072845 RepID=UPI00129B9F4C|nr:DUF748 domain-containing protein [Endozoicomonas sp. OPT23]MRI35361.1 hypothetical protein [Endozoicomonas sp. OPT23]